MAPSVPPAAINANNRVAWDAENRSDINVQNTEIMKRLTTLNHT